MIIFDFDQTLVDTSPVESLRASRDWKGVMARVERLDVYPGINELLAALSASGHRLAIVTKSPDMVAKWFIAQNDWPIDVLIGYHQVKRRKPDPEGLLLAMERVNAVPQNSYHIGDQVQDTQAARAAGMIPIGVTWGIGDDAELRASNPDALFASVEELARYFADLDP